MLDPIETARWYHTIDLPGGVVTPGHYDLRPTLKKLPFPASLEGMRCLDIGTRDGFWAFEMEKRGAAEVVAIDLFDFSMQDFKGADPGAQVVAARRGLGEAAAPAFEIARSALGSKVERRDFSVYDLTPEATGKFDFVFLGSLLLHLRDPVGALMATRSVTKGVLLLNEVISGSLTVLRPKGAVAGLMDTSDPYWWIPNAAALRLYVESAGFVIERSSSRPYLQPVRQASESAVQRGRLPWREILQRPISHAPSRLAHRRGTPTMWVLARPRPVGP